MLNENIVNTDIEVSGESINKYVQGLYRLSVATGKLDSLLCYIEQTYPQDRFLTHSLSSILKDIVIVNQDSKYERAIMPQQQQKNNIVTQPISKMHSVKATASKEQPLSTPQVQTPHEDIKTPSVIAEGCVEKDLDIDADFYYELVNSSHVKEIWYSTRSKLLRVKFKGNQREYHYISVPECHVKSMVLLDKQGGSASKYFNENIKKNYGYREVSGDNEELVG